MKTAIIDFFDEANCDGGKKWVMKEGDEGIEPIKDRLLMDEEILKKHILCTAFQKYY